jgi:hypothetical protein
MTWKDVTAQTLILRKTEVKKKFYPFFSDCIGALDGTHVAAKVPAHEAAHSEIGRDTYLRMSLPAAILTTCSSHLF